MRNGEITYDRLLEAEEFHAGVVCKIRSVIGVVEPEIDPGDIHFCTMWKLGNGSDNDLICVNLEIGTTDWENWISLTMPIELLNIENEDVLKSKWAEWRTSEQVKFYKTFETSYLNFKKNERFKHS